MRSLCSALAIFALTLTTGIAAASDETGAAMSKRFAREVDRRLTVPAAERVAYAKRLERALQAAGHDELAPQYVVLVDRDPNVQAVFVYWRSLQHAWHFIGATPASTGRPGRFEHFVTPLGVFEHTPDNMDYRAEGTKNDVGIRGYGERGMRVYDFGWVIAERGWGPPGKSEMRLQMHATDPDRLEPLLGTARSKGCIRIPASLNVFIDRYGLIDAEYERVAEDGGHLWVLHPERTVTQWPGKFLVVVDSRRERRPHWSPLPGRRR